MFDARSPVEYRYEMKHQAPATGTMPTPSNSARPAQRLGPLVCVFIATLGVSFFAFPMTVIGQDLDSKLEKTFYRDFRKADSLDDDFKLIGPDATSLTKFEPEGLRISLPAKRITREPIGVAPRFKIKGDFEITVSYEIINADPPKRMVKIRASKSILSAWAPPGKVLGSSVSSDPMAMTFIQCREGQTGTALVSTRREFS
jgi:hypothetical protein